VLSNGAMDPPAIESSEADEVEAKALSDADPTWRDASGKRYEAMLVLPDGTTFGRKGPAPDQIAPTEQNEYGSDAGVAGRSSDITSAEIESALSVLEQLPEHPPSFDPNEPRPGVRALQIVG